MATEKRRPRPSPEDLTLVFEMDGIEGVLEVVAAYPPDDLIVIDGEEATVEELRRRHEDATPSDPPRSPGR